MSIPTTNNNIETTLTELGLGQNEAKLYEILLNLPDATIPALQAKSLFSRTMLYHILENLAGYELVETKEINKKTVYNAVHPEKLEGFIADQEKALHRQKEQLQTILGDLRSTYNLAHNKPGVKFFEGPNGIKETTFDSLKAKGEIYTFLDVEATQKYAGEMNKKYVAERIKLGIHKKQIALDTPFTRARYKTLPPTDRLLEVRLMPATKNPFQTGMQIYNDTVSFTTFTADKQIGVIVEDASIAQMQRALFEYIWNSLPALQAASNISTGAPDGGRTNSA